MIAYGIGALLLIRDLRRSHPRVTHPWYADDAGAGGKFEDVLSHFRDLQLRGPARGYFPEPTKRILVVAEGNVPREVSLQHWLLRFGAASGELRHIVAEIGEWLSNGRPPWAAYRAMMSGRLIALDKSSGIRPVGIGETWRCLLEKCLLRVIG